MEHKYFFSVLTPSYKRIEMLRRAVESVTTQDYADWEMIIVNDDPNSSLDIQTITSDTRVRMITNDTNRGANWSRNRALSLVSPASTQVIFLDDDDYLASGAFMALAELLEVHPNTDWLVTNRAFKHGTSLTEAPRSYSAYRYGWDYLIKRTIRGDATHCIETRVATSIAFPQGIKNGEEWLYFLELSQYKSLFYVDQNITLTDGYAEHGLNFRRRNTLDQLRTIRVLLQDGLKRKGIRVLVVFWIYLSMRILRAFIKRT
jgi:glycosyltransferase involved in cell wall biosynthesis